CLHELFEAQAARTPEAVALVFGEEQVSYGELDRRANQLGHYLRQQGVGAEVLVGVCVERSVAMVVALLGILKAGGAYLPLDPAYPAERLSFMLADAGVTVLLTEPALRAQFGASAARVVCLEVDAAAIGAQSEAQLSSQTAADNLAYVIYTSGSTGQPKGVQITHRSLINFLTSMRHQPGMSDQDSFLSIATLSFDISGLELYLPLLVGGRVVLVSREIATDGAALARYLMNTDVTLMQATPAMWRILVEAGWQGSESLKILCGGEALTPELAQELLRRSKELWNVYGPTETTVWCGALKVEMTDNTIRIGGPIANTQLYVLDDYLELTPIGVTGELYIGGAGLGRGYLNRSALTAEKFIPNHFSNEGGERLYRTGDLVRYLADGRLEYLGRIDNQVKLRGFRIELGEVEATLAQHPAVIDQAVVVREDVPGNKLLVAYIVTKDEAPLTSTELRSYLKERLPDYMVPSVFAMLASLPLTPNGKVDRKALPAPERIGMGPESTYLAPRTATEEILVEMWATLIGVQPVGVNDNFFELGGHSLLATQLIFRLRKKFRIEIPLYELFKEPTIAGLAITIEILLERVKALEPVVALSESRKERRLLSHSQQRLWFLAQLEPETPVHNESIALRLNGKLDVAVLQQSINEIIRRHEVLRATFTSEDGQAVQMVLAELKIDLPLQDLTATPASLREAEAQRIITEEVRRPFNLSQDPLLRAHLLRLNEAEHVLVLLTHHIVCDHSSLGLLVRELTALYDAYQQRQPSPLPELLMQYADFARRQHDWVKTEALKTQLPYWKQQLAGAESVPELVPDKPRPAVRSFNGARHKLRISPHLFQALKALSEQQSATLFMTVLTVLDVLLNYYTQSANIVLGTDVAGRDTGASESLIGPFVNQLALSTHVSGDPKFSELLAQVRETVRAAQAHQGLPFEEIVEALKPARDRGRTPLFQLKLVNQNPPLPELELSELRIAPLEIETGMASFDMTMFMEETSQELSVIFEYNTDLYEPRRVGSISSCLEILLEKVAVETEARVSVLKDLLRETEQQQEGRKQAELKTSVGQKLRNLKRKTIPHVVKETIVSAKILEVTPAE
ncbi:MAG TPA: amino acid adenylation domain-containing protein, partial [Pyrinomonadaceae bacterium]|nr:amino acid adenylation domain-containing protein [Pyrinomonadaceae bacterium]